MHILAYTLVIIGAVNWGLVGFFQFDVVAAILGDMTGAARVIYGLVGLAAIWEVVTHKNNCKVCGGMKSSAGGPNPAL